MIGIPRRSLPGRRNRHLRRAFATGLTAAALCVPAPTAVANHVVVRDRDDTPGRLDVRRAEPTGVSPHKMTIKTHNAWGVNDIFDRGYLLVYLDTFGGNRFDYFILLRPERGNMRGNVWRDVKNGNDRQIARTKVGRANRRTIRTTVPLRKMRIPATQVDYRWHVRTIYAKRGCYRAVCIDRAPNSESVVEPLVP